MEPRISLITLGVTDMDRSRAFYETLGWKASSQSNDDVTFFQAGGSIFGLYGRAALAKDAAVEDARSGSAGLRWPTTRATGLRSTPCSKKRWQ